MYLCENCGKCFTRESSLRRHLRESCKGSEEPLVKRAKIDAAAGPSTSRHGMVKCSCCDKIIYANAQASHWRTLEHRSNACIDFMPGIKLIQSAFKSRIATYRITSENRCTDYNTFLSSVQGKVIKLLEDVLKIHKLIKVSMELFGRYSIQTKELIDNKSFNTPNIIIDSSKDLTETFNEFKDIMMRQTTEFQERDSGWALEYIMYIEVNVNKFSGLGGSSHIKLPKLIENRKAVINVHNQDECCFLWAITSALYPARARTSDISSYPHFSTLFDTEGMTFPVKLKHIPKFEEKNQISVNVYGIENKFENNKMTPHVVGPLYYAKKKMNTHVNLLLITSECGNIHYCWIKDLSRLVSSQICNTKCRKYFCDGCLLYFSGEMLLKAHQENDCNHKCAIVPSTKVRVDRFGSSTPGNIIKFESFEKQIEVPFVVYADFESVLKPLDTCEPNPQESYTYKNFKHEPYSFAYIIKCSFDDRYSKFELYRGADAATIFVKTLETDLINIYDHYLKRIIPMKKLSPQEVNDYANAIICNICDKPFEQGDVKVKDHCHLTGKFRGAAHHNCNLNYKLPNFVPIIFHNMSNYDNHLFIKTLFSDECKVDVIAQSKEQYISFTKYLHVDNYPDKNGHMTKKYLKLRFIDSFRFMSSSLRNLGENLAHDLFFETRKYFPDESKFKLMRQKGVFPYSFVDCMDKLNYANLPSKEDFYDNLNDESISDADFNRAREVWDLFDCRTLGQYSDVYLKSDVLLLCDVFQNFRQLCMGIYKLDPAQYFTAPGLAWGAMLRLTDVELELLTDIDMIHMIKKGIRGGISQCSDRKHIANNIFLPNYNPEEPSSFITYLDATNLYGHSMSQTLPTGRFAFLTEQEIDNLDIMNISNDSPEGFILEVDVMYPQELHDKHSDLPFLVENIIPPKSKSKLSKLIPNLNNKQKYVVHYRNLKQAIENGLILTKIHRVLKFSQSCWLKKYIDLNTEMRNKSRNKFEKDFYKLMNNAVFGKTMENVENRRDIRLLTHWGRAGRRIGASELIAHPNFKTCSVFSENFVAIHMEMLRIAYNKPIYIGFSILELSKIVLYDFFYNVIKRNFKRNASLLYTDTDSLIIKIYTENFYNFINENINKFDTSNYRPGNKFNITVSPSVLGRMKDEFPEDPIVCFYGTGAKAYYVQSIENEIKRAKGVKRSVVKKELTIDDYSKIVEKGGLIFRKMMTFTTHLHDIYTEVKNKVALSHNDDKRFIIPNTTKTLAWGHSDIEFYETSPEQNLSLLMQCLNNEARVKKNDCDNNNFVNISDDSINYFCSNTDDQNLDIAHYLNNEVKVENQSGDTDIDDISDDFMNYICSDTGDENLDAFFKNS